jgi:hypothetical protein
MNHTQRILSLTLPLLIGMATSASAQAPAPQPMIGHQAPAIALTTVQGGSLNLEDLRGQIVVIHFGASW